jgi:hypothetical protein
VLFVNSSLAEDPWQVAAEDAWHTLAEDADKAAIMAKVRGPAEAAAQPADVAGRTGADAPSCVRNIPPMHVKHKSLMVMQG